MKTLIYIIFLAAFLFIACEKGNTGGDDPSAELNFESLLVSRDTLFPGETSTITAIASGYNLSYHWSASQGDILGSGNEVTYLPSPCHVGTNSISCEVVDGHDESETRTVSIVVL